MSGGATITGSGGGGGMSLGSGYRMGWVCPKCNRAVSPDCKTCPCFHPVSIGGAGGGAGGGGSR